MLKRNEFGERRLGESGKVQDLDIDGHTGVVCIANTHTSGGTADDDRSLSTFWSITQGGFFAPERRRSRQRWRESSIGWGGVQRAGGLAWRSCARVACSAGSLPRVERSCGRRPRGGACDGSATWLGVRPFDARLIADRNDPQVSPPLRFPPASHRRGLPIISR
jgi:hypothetical protein